MKIRYYVITGVVAYLLFLIAGIPASLVVPTLNRNIQVLEIVDAGGSLWHGHAARVTILHRYRMDMLDWDIRFSRLLFGELAANISTEFEQNKMVGEAGIGATGRIVLHDFRAEIDAARVAQLARIPLAQFSGQLDMQIDDAGWTPQQVPELNGQITWHNATVSVSEKVELGDISIKLQPGDDSNTMATIKNTGGDLGLDGIAKLGDDGSYSLQLEMSPRAHASRNLLGSLRMFAKPQGNNFVYSNNGNLKQFGLM